MSFTLLTVAIALIFGVVCLIRICRGVHQGLRSALISLAADILALLVSLMLTPVLSLQLARAAYWAAQKFVLYQIKPFVEILDIFPSLPDLIVALLGMALSTLLFVAVFFVLRLIICMIAKKICSSPKAANGRNPGYGVEKNSYFDKNSRSLGGIVGFVSAIVITMVITCPIMGTLDVATDCLSIATKAYSKVNRYIGERNYEAVFEYSDDILGNAFYQFGGKLIYRSVASTYLYGEKVYLMPEIENADATAAVAIPFYYQIVSQRYDAKTQVAYINGMCEGLEQTEVCDGILADCTRKFSEKWSAGRRFYGISRPETNDLIDPFLDEVFHACIYTTKDDVKQNLTTVLQIMAVVIESDVLYVDTDHYEQVMEVLEDSNLIAELDKLLESNPSMQNIKTSSILMRVLASHIDSLEYEQEIYDSMMTDLADAINAVNNKGYGSHEEKAQALALHVVNVLKNYGVTISQGIAEQVAPELLALHADQEADVSAAQVREMIERYAQ